MADLGDITQAIADIAESVVGIRAVDYVPDLTNPPQAFIQLNTAEEATFAFETVEFNLDFVIVTARGAAPRIGQRSLYSFYRPLCEAFAANKDLGLGDGTEARVVSYRSLSIEEIAATSLYGGAYPMIVTSPG